MGWGSGQLELAGDEFREICFEVPAAAREAFPPGFGSGVIEHLGQESVGGGRKQE